VSAQQSAPAVSGISSVPWFKGGVEAAFAAAKAQNKPLFLYWGAIWCPYCNQVKATLFNRADFAERAKNFIPVELDGDSPEGQKLGAHFKVRGYPTMILFKPDGTEITRLPGEVDAARYLQVLSLGISAERPVRETLAAALKGKELKPEEWRLLAYYAFEADEASGVPADALPDVLAKLARAVPAKEPELATRLALKALSAKAELTPQPKLAGAAAAQLIDKVLDSPAEVRGNFDLIVANPDKVISLVTPPGDARKALAAKWDAALTGLSLNASLSTTDRLSATGARVALARIDGAKLPEALAKLLGEQVHQADTNTRNGYERHSVIYTAAGILGEAGLLDASDALLKAELKRSSTPYYFMRMLGGNAKKRGDKTAALKWYEDAWTAASGGATRLQWGGGYIAGLIDLAPADSSAIEAATVKLFDEAGKTPDAFYERNRAVLEKTAKKLVEWSAANKQAAVIARLKAKLDSVCKALPEGDAQHPVCAALFSAKR
jgi:thiol-disulfide isomerase/thioredoxin